MNGHETVSGYVVEREHAGVEYQLFVNDRFTFSRRFATLQEAAEHVRSAEHRQRGNDRWRMPEAV